MMNYPEYIQTKEYRDRLLRLIESGRKILPTDQFESFSMSFSAKVRQLEHAMSQFEESSSGSLCRWFGLRTFNVTAVIAESANESTRNVRWNSPIPQASFVEPVIRPSQKSLIPDESERIPLPVLLPA
jgi:hypothetical protein